MIDEIVYYSKYLYEEKYVNHGRLCDIINIINGGLYDIITRNFIKIKVLRGRVNIILLHVSKVTTAKFMSMEFEYRRMKQE